MALLKTHLNVLLFITLSLTKPLRLLVLLPWCRQHNKHNSSRQKVVHDFSTSRGPRRVSVRKMKDTGH